MGQLRYRESEEERLNFLEIGLKTYDRVSVRSTGGSLLLVCKVAFSSPFTPTRRNSREFSLYGSLT